MALDPGTWLGLLGGGQLGRMFTQAAQSLGYKVCVLDPDPDSPTGAVADLHLNAGYLDDDALAQMDALCRAVTTEFENVPAGALDRLQRNCAVSPAGRCVAIAQDRAVEKAFIAAQGVPVAPHAVIVSAADLAVGDDVGPLGGEGFQKGDQVVVTVEAGEVDGRHELETSNVIADQ